MKATVLCRLGLLVSMAVAIGAAVGCSRAEPPAPRAVHWVQMTEHGAEARAIADTGTCPPAELDGRAAPMAVRAPAGPDFPMVCSLPIPTATGRVTIAGETLTFAHGSPVATPQRIVVIGDTGCRVRGTTSQSCNDGKAWPFARIAALAAAKSPDLLIHVGDYYYRETACPLGMRGCAGSPSGDRYDTWRADLFDPAAPLLAGAPVLFVRGNHEACKRGGRGWRQLLSAMPWRPGCDDPEDAFVVHLGALSLGVLDSSVASDRDAPPRAVAQMQAQFDRLAADLGSGESFIVTHRPIWAAVPVGRMGPFGAIFVGLNHTEQVAARGRILPQTDLILSGHVHHFAAYSYGPDRPAQLVAGEGGDKSVEADTAGFDHKTLRIDGLVARKLNFARYGYVLMDRVEGGWRIEARDTDDQIAAVCRLVGRDLACEDGARPAR